MTPAVEALLGAPHAVGVAHQPIVDLRSATVRGYAAVARFPCHDGRPARAWFDEAAAAGSPGVLEAQVVQAAVVARPLLARGRFLTVALSDAALRSDPVRAAFAAEPALDHVVVEVDGEGDAVGDVAGAAAVLRTAGARLALDLTRCSDSGLPRVAGLRPEWVRVSAADGEDLPALYEALADLALDQDPRLIAGGVDDDAQVDALLAHGVRFAQGDALGGVLPVPGELARSVRMRLRHRAPEDLGALAEPGLAVGASGLSLDASTSVRDAARQAMARPPAVRFDPIAVVAGDGSLLGVVPIDRLVSALTG